MTSLPPQALPIADAATSVTGAEAEAACNDATSDTADDDAQKPTVRGLEDPQYRAGDNRRKYQRQGGRRSDSRRDEGVGDNGIGDRVWKGISYKEDVRSNLATNDDDDVDDDDDTIRRRSFDFWNEATNDMQEMRRNGERSGDVNKNVGITHGDDDDDSKRQRWIRSRSDGL
jgi:hypothetical protein